MFRQLARTVKHHWKMNPLRKRWIKNIQRRTLDAGKGDLDRVIIFLVPGVDMVNGGIMSIISLADETAKLRHIHGSEVFVCPSPGQPPLLRFTRFSNSRALVDFNLLLSNITPGAAVLIHIPEIYVASFVDHCRNLLPSLAPLRIEYNILLQNIDSIPASEDVEQLKMFGTVSVTAAHKSYAIAHADGLMGCRLWHLSVWISPEQYEYRSFMDKKNIIVVSPDSHPDRNKILDQLRSELPEFEFVVVQKMTYQEYKALIAMAKFALTFGEGLDGYFAETIFSGGIGCAVYNSRFFTDEYRSLPCVYSSWNDLIAHLPKDISRLNDEKVFTGPHLLQFNQLASDYSYDNYKRNLEKFYLERFRRTDAKNKNYTLENSK